MTTPMPIKGLLPYFGGKRSMAPEIVRQVCWPKPPAFFVEPFCGSCAVSLAMPDVQTHIVNDLNGDLVNLAMVLASPRGGDLAERAERVLCADALHQSLVAESRALREVGLAERPSVVTDTHIEWALAYLVAEWLGPNGFSGTNKTGTIRLCKRFGPGGGDPAGRWRSVSESIDAWVERARRWTILSEDGMELIGKLHDKPGCAIYADPPYLRSTRGSGDCSYIHDFTDAGGDGLFGAADDHDRLAEALNAKQHTRVVVSYYDDPRLDDLYPGWTKLRIDRHKSTHNVTRSGPSAWFQSGHVGEEVLLINGPAAPMAA